MKTIRLFIGLLALWALSGVLSSSATAQIGPWGVWAPWYSNPYAPYAYSYGSIPSPPYFAVHPPVYYGPRIRMAYGQTPVAHPPLTVIDVRGRAEASEAPRQAGLTIRNPYVVDASAGSSKGTGAAQPHIITNPYDAPKKGKRGGKPRTTARPRAPAAEND